MVCRLARAAQLVMRLAASVVAVASLSSCAVGLREPAPDAMFTPEQLHQDLAVIESSIRATHPDIGHSAGGPELDRMWRRLAQQLSRPLSRDAAWRTFATVNPVLADGHLFVGFSDWRAQAQAHVEAGGVFFPFEVDVGPNGRVIVLSGLGGSPTPHAGKRIMAINGVGAGVVAAELLSRMHGDTPTFRAGVLSGRWWFFYWKLYGASREFDLAFDGGSDPVRIAGSAASPATLADESAFERQFKLERLPGRSALLTVGTFYWSDRKRFFDFMQETFRTLRDEGTTTLIIDVRRNGGGDDDMWIQGILKYIATQPYRWGSRYTKRIIEKYRDAGETAGDVVHGTIDRRIEPELDHPLRYAGDVFVLIGRSTYSSAILFSNVVQDFGFGVVAGEGGSARASQTGGVQQFALPNTGLAVWSPRFVLIRPSGNEAPRLVEPDIPLADDPLHPFAAVDALLRLAGDRQRAAGR